MRFLLLFLLLPIFSYADIYMHNPRGSNNRLDEAGRERNNANRVFNSQNNNRGGYNKGTKMVFYGGSKLPIEWTSQHSCADQNTHCDIIIQYMCSEKARDGTTTNTIKQKNNDCNGKSCDADPAYGLHEDWAHYTSCSLSNANNGLYGTKGKKWRATQTRQNPNGDRYGYECQEERDYYPYWRPTPWRDIAILTDSPYSQGRCQFYQSQSENVLGREYCAIPNYALEIASTQNTILNNKADCEKFTYTDGSKVHNGIWKRSSPHNLPPPVCRPPEWSRDNHLGNAGRGFERGDMSTFNWTLPDVESEELNCVLRLRYNISTGDYSDWQKTTADSNVNAGIASKVGLSAADGNRRGYRMENNPNVILFDDLPNLKLTLAVNPAQFGRTFQDRSHVFSVIPRKQQHVDFQNQTIYNLNVRGKRGNIVQVFPAVEYDFVPNTLFVRENEFIHVQWTGTNNNDKNNDGQGTAGTDRSNIVVQGVSTYKTGDEKKNNNNNDANGGAYVVYTNQINGNWGRGYPTKNYSNFAFGGFNDHDLTLLAFNQYASDNLLNQATPYFNLKPRKVTQSGAYHYMCSRNNNFSNRSQKGRLIVTNVVPETYSLGPEGGSVTSANNSVTVTFPEDSVDQLTFVNLEVIPVAMEKQMNMPAAPPGDSYASDFVKVSLSQIPHKMVDIKIRTTETSCMSHFIVYATDTSGAGVWRLIDSSPHCEYSSDKKVSFVTVKLIEPKTGQSQTSTTTTTTTSFQTNNGQQLTYVVRKTNNLVTIVVGVVCSVVLVLLVVAGVWFYCKRNPALYFCMRRAVARPSNKLSDANL